LEETEIKKANTLRDIFEDAFSHSPLDPTEAARRNARTRTRRFYEGVEARPGGIALDGRPVRTPARRLLAAPTTPLTEAIAEEWRAQREFIEPAKMPLTRLANTIIDGIASAAPEPGQTAATGTATLGSAAEAVAEEIVKYLGSDLVCYRAPTPAALAARQAAHWDPLVAWARDELGAPLRVGTRITHLAQLPESIAAARAHLPRHPWRLGAVHAITTLTGSAAIGLAVAAGAIGRDDAWAAAHVDEDWNMEFWGRDTLALERRALRFAEMAAATQVLDGLN
jgi:chaperone required for assembly of F1-ATPase